MTSIGTILIKVGVELTLIISIVFSFGIRMLVYSRYKVCYWIH